MGSLARGALSSTRDAQHTRSDATMPKDKPRLLAATLVTVAPSSNATCPGKSFVCSLPAWCSSQPRQAGDGGSMSVDIGVLTYKSWNVGRECPGAIALKPGGKFLNAVQGMYSEDNPMYHGKCSQCAPHEAIVLALKWWLVRLDEYDLVFYSDLDVDFPRMNVPHLKSGLVEFAAHREAVIAADSDWASPINCGVMVLKPNRQTYIQGLALLNTRIFNTTMGFGGIGRPRSLRTHSHPQQWYGSRFDRNRFNNSNTWNIPAGSSDQGLFSLFFHLRGPPRYLRHRVQIQHFWYKSKPFVYCRRWVEAIKLSPNSLCNATVSRWLATASNACMKHGQAIL